MKVQKFIADNMNEALKKIRLDLGEDAVILNSKQVTKGRLFGFIKKKKIEVIAAIDPQPNEENLRTKEKISRIPSSSVKRMEINEDFVHQDPNVTKELAELKSMVQHLSKAQNANTFQHFPVPIQKFLEHLQWQGLCTETISDLGEKLVEEWRSSSKELTLKAIAEKGKSLLKDELSRAEYGGVNYKKKFINIVGPTGVGKTTTLAKMAAQAILEQRKKIAFITTDTYRIAAIEQLKTYSSILNVPVEVVYKMSDFQKAVDKFIDYDLIFIDTAGRNFREQQYIDELQNIIDFSQDIETFLTLSLTMKEEDIHDIVTCFSRIKVDKFIFTKLDETTTWGSMANIIKKYQIGAAYLTNGQDVPDDIQKADADLIVRQIVKGIEK